MNTLQFQTEEKSKYILKTQETNFIPEREKDKLYTTLRIVVWIIIGIIVVGSFVFGSNLFYELSWTARVILVTLAIGVLFKGKKTIPTPSDLEIRFYNNYLIMYGNKRYYNPKTTRVEYDKFLYKDIRECDYDWRTKRLTIHGVVEGKWFDYSKDGSVSPEPTYHKTTNSLSFFYVYGEDFEEIISALENYTGKKVQIRNKPEE